MRSLAAAVCALPLALVALSAQDKTDTKETKVKVDDARTALVTGCLMPDPAGGVMLVGATMSIGDDLKIKTESKTDVDDHDATVKTTSEATLENAKKVGTAGTSATYLVTARQGVDLLSHVGERVQLAAVIVEPRTGHDDDAKISIEEKSKRDVENGRDQKQQEKTKLEVPRGNHATIAALSVKPIGGTCQ